MAFLYLVRKHVENFYSGSCDVWEYEKKLDENGITYFEETLKQEAIPCQLSYRAAQSAGNGKAASVSQDILLFLSPDISIRPGSKLLIRQNGITAKYKNSGIPTNYMTHQEISLTVFEGWA